MPAWIFRRAKSLDLCGLQKVETVPGILYLSEAQKCLSIVPRGTEKAGKKFLTSYPLFTATCLPAVKLVFKPSLSAFIFQETPLLLSDDDGTDCTRITVILSAFSTRSDPRQNRFLRIRTPIEWIRPPPGHNSGNCPFYKLPRPNTIDLLPGVWLSARWERYSPG